ncbi:MAG: hypothetical protein SNH88_07105 [Rikenellaceae bacterium]
MTIMEQIITPEEVVSLALKAEGYFPCEEINQNDILIAQQRYLRPIIGQPMIEAIARGEHSDLCQKYILPPLAELVRHVVFKRLGRESSLTRARALLAALSQELDTNAASYKEYNPRENILKRCQIHGAHIQRH